MTEESSAGLGDVQTNTLVTLRVIICNQHLVQTQSAALIINIDLFSTSTVVATDFFRPSTSPRVCNDALVFSIEHANGTAYAGNEVVIGSSY